MPAEATPPPAKRAGRRRVRPALLSLAQVAELLGVGLSTAERLKAAGRIGPRPVHLAGPKYRRRELLAWLDHAGPTGDLPTATEWAALWPQLQADLARRPNHR